MATIAIPITKAKGVLSPETDQIPPEMWAEVVYQGLKVVLNKGTSKITKAQYPDPEELKAAAMEKAEEMLAALMSGDTSVIKLTGAPKKAKVSGAVMTEARRRARQVVKDTMKEAGIKISHVKSAQITKAANDYLGTDEGAELIEEAKAEIEARGKKKATIDVSAIEIDPDLKAKDEARKAKAKATLSATQAGRVQARARVGTSSRPGAGPARS